MVQLTLLSLPAPVLSIATRYCKLVVDEKKKSSITAVLFYCSTEICCFCIECLIHPSWENLMWYERCGRICDGQTDRSFMVDVFMLSYSVVT